MENWLTHLATNGAGTIHDFEYAFLGRSTESVQENVETGTFGQAAALFPLFASTEVV